MEGGRAGIIRDPLLEDMNVSIERPICPDRLQGGRRKQGSCKGGKEGRNGKEGHTLEVGKEMSLESEAERSDSS